MGCFRKKRYARVLRQFNTACHVAMLNKETLIYDLRSLDALGILDPSDKKNKLELQEEARNHFLSTVTVNEEGRFRVSLSWLDNHLPLKNNYELELLKD
ncbi:hypothetical protein AVEN_179058-1 [Araneus ventricosus]|uniref:Uncharacterized protein n=1 Tax=Araneus ventricosus TaxID=182803 RepID=A0A4Y2UZ71_ARAVE|nr:hypothetical protein AVEN_179058-1 [Araneus ventricosus]